VTVHVCQQTASEPTSVTKSLSIQPAVDAFWSDPKRSFVNFASPNILELLKLYQGIVHGADGSPRSNLVREALNRFSLGSDYRIALEHLARRPASDKGPDKDTLNFLTTDGVAQMAVSLLPVFQHLIIKCGKRGVVLAMRVQDDGLSMWAAARSDPQQRLVVAHGNGETIVLKHFPALAISSDKIVNVTGAGDSLVGALLATLVQNPSALQDPRTIDESVMLAQKAAVLTLQSDLAVSPLLSTGLY
jgi:pseudouridine-5'-phosphate glycosidase/pseudouridine kinase